LEARRRDIEEERRNKVFFGIERARLEHREERFRWKTKSRERRRGDERSDERSDKRSYLGEIKER